MGAFTLAERRARLGVRHRLAPPARADDPVAAAQGVVALHGTDAASVFVSAWARAHGGDVAAVERALYDDRALVRVMGMRRTMWVAPARDAATIIAACGRDVAARERRRLGQLLAEARPGDRPDALIDAAEALALAALHEHTEATGAEVAAHDELLGTELVLGAGTSVETRQKLAGRVLLVLAAEGRVVRTRPRGGWTSTQYRWAALDTWCPEAVACLGAGEARVELARRWLRAFGPASVEDLRWWTGWGVTDTRRALAAAGAVEVDCAGVPGIALPDDLEPQAPAAPWAALLPALDPTVMGWKARRWFLGEHEGRLFDRTGNASPTVWWDGRVVGGWAHRADGEIAFELLEEVGADAVAAIEAEAERLRARLGDVRLAPRARARSEVEAALVR